MLPAPQHLTALGLVPRRQLGALVDIGAIVSAVSDRRRAAEEVLDVFSRVVPYAAASIQAWDPVAGRHETVASSGYPEHAVKHLDTWFVGHDEAYRFMRDVDPRPLRWRDMPFDYRRLYSASAVFIPLGFDEGVTACLYDADRRYTGNLHFNTDSCRHPSDDAMQAVYVLQSVLSGVVDVLRTPAWLARSLGDGGHAVLVADSGEVLTLPGCAAGPHLEPGPLTSLVAQNRDRIASGSMRFLWRDEAGEWHRVRLERLGHSTLVLEKPIALPHGLTAREVDVLTLVAKGQSNPDIAVSLTVSVKTVAKHVEHLLTKLECRSRAALAARALSAGLMRLPAPGRT